MRLAGLLLSLLLLAGCGGVMSALDPQGPSAAAIANIWWVMFWGSLLLAGGTYLLLWYVMRRGSERRIGMRGALGLMVGGGIALPLAVIVPLLWYGVSLGSVQSEVRVPAALGVEVVGHRFWWEVRYQDPLQPDEVVVTANEIHIPAGVPVDFTVRSDDVIHSFWIPNLGGKIDMIPGRANRTRLQADSPGLFRGQCAEFCGPQHARMAFFVRALPPAEFDRWLLRERGEAPEPDSELQFRGLEAFFENGCADCHTIRGTGANGRIGPDLTRIGSRMSIGAGTLEGGADNLAEWIAHNQRLKPGNRMLPFDHLEEETLEAIAAYLESLE